MSTTTTNYKLIKPELTDAADITATNPNWDIVDQQLDSTKKRLDDVGDNKIDRESTYGLVTMGRIQEGDKSWETIEMKDSLEADLTATRKIPAYLSDLEDDVGYAKNLVFEATSTDGINYTISDVNGAITEFYDGLEINIIPKKLSASKDAKLTIAGTSQRTYPFAVRSRKRTVSGEIWYSTTPPRDSFLTPGHPIKLLLDNADGWIIQDMSNVYGDELASTVPISKGGTGATTLTQIKSNLDIPTNLSDLEGVLPTSKGGTGATTLEELKSNLNSLTTYTAYTLLASKWQGDTAPYTYLIDDEEYVGKEVNVYEDGALITAEQLDVLASANIKGSPTSSENILYAFGDKPTIDLPVALGVK